MRVWYSIPLAAGTMLAVVAASPSVAQQAQQGTMMGSHGPAMHSATQHTQEGIGMPMRAQ